MSNQRPGKFKTATIRDASGMNTVTFFKNARKLLEEYGHEDAAFYFEQVETHLRDGKSLPVSEKDVRKVYESKCIGFLENPRVAKFFAKNITISISVL